MRAIGRRLFCAPGSWGWCSSGPMAPRPAAGRHRRRAFQRTGLQSTRAAAMAPAVRERIGIGKDDDISDDLSVLYGQPAPPPRAALAALDLLRHAVFKLFTTRHGPFVRCHGSRRKGQSFAPRARCRGGRTFFQSGPLRLSKRPGQRSRSSPSAGARPPSVPHRFRLGADQVRGIGNAG